MNKQKFSLSLLLLGIALAVASWIWPQVWSGYTEEQALAFGDASVAYHESLHEGEHVHAHDAELTHDIPATREKYKQAIDDAKRARALQDRLPRYLLWLGTSIGCLGGIGYFVTKNE